MRRAIASLILASLVLAIGLSIGGGHRVTAEDRTIDQLNVGTYWQGPKIDRADLKGKVVLVWLWGQ